MGNTSFGRRSFLAGLGAAGIVPARAASSRSLPDPIRVPDLAEAFGENQTRIALTRVGDRWQAGGIEVATEIGTAGAEAMVLVAAPKAALTRIRLRWHGAFPSGWRYLGDHWERSYGELEFRGLAGERLMPWYFLASDGREVHGYGVRTGAASICCWQVDAGGVTLWLDVSNGGAGVRLADRRLDAATIVTRRAHDGESGLESATAFCRALCARPLLPRQPVYGSNNWYYAYGRDTSAARTMRDAELMAELAPAGSANRPFVVIDMGWHAAPDGAGPVTESSKDYPDMPGLAKKMRALGVRPGIWTRPTLTSEAKTESWRLPPIKGRPASRLIVLDPSIPEALAYMAAGVRTLHEWGYELIKYDYSSFDIWGRWGFEMGPDLTDPGWSFQDRSRTTAEILTGLYRAIREAAGSSLLIGCNTVGHLAAGLVELQRIGDDTSGREWSRTRKMGVNALAFRMPQHGTFFDADADCVAVTRDVPWDLTRQWLDLVARSGTALFVSADPDALEADWKQILKRAFAAASERHAPGVALDWMDNTTPDRWRLDGKLKRFDWYMHD
jgi:alpha-galactosidase